MRHALAAAALLAALAAPRDARACDPATAELRRAEIDRHLAGEARKARQWNRGWAVTFAGLSAIQLGAIAIEWVPLQDYDHDVEVSLWLGAGKAAIASGARLVLPLKVVRPRATGDACADLAAAEAALRETGKRQRASFFLGHAAGLAFNVGTLLYLGLVEDAWDDGVVSVALGYPIGLLSVYTQPRRSWTVGVVPSEGGGALTLAGAF